MIALDLAQLINKLVSDIAMKCYFLNAQLEYFQCILVYQYYIVGLYSEIYCSK